MPLTTISSDALNNVSELIDRAASGDERVIVTREGKEVAAIISADDLHYFERLEEEAQDRQDVADAEAALAEAEVFGTMSLEDFVEELRREDLAS